MVTTNTTTMESAFQKELKEIEEYLERKLTFKEYVALKTRNERPKIELAVPQWDHPREIAPPYKVTCTESAEPYVVTREMMEAAHQKAINTPGKATTTDGLTVRFIPKQSTDAPDSPKKTFAGRTGSKRFY